MTRPTTRFSRRSLLAATAATSLAFPFVSFAQATKKKLVLIAGKPSHPPGMHEFNAGVTLLNNWLSKVPSLDVSVHRNHWVSDDAVLDAADAVLIYSDGGGGHPALQKNHKQLLQKCIDRGVGLMCAHYAVEVPGENGGPEFQKWIGGYYENAYSVNPIWEPEYTTFPDHPITRGVTPFKARDEWYFNMRWRPETEGITHLLTAKPSDEVRNGPYVHPKGPYPHIQEAKGRTETMMWAIERPDGGRGVGFTGGHYHNNWGIPSFRKIVLNALLWIAKVEVPTNGVESSLAEGELLQNLDPKGRRA